MDCQGWPPRCWGRAVLAYLLCVVLVALIGLCLAEVGSRVSDAGGLYAYATVRWPCAMVAVSGSFRYLVVAGTAGTLVLYLICCLALLPLRALGVGHMRATISRTGWIVGAVCGFRDHPAAVVDTRLGRLAAATFLVVSSAVVYALHEHWRRDEVGAGVGVESAP